MTTTDTYPSASATLTPSRAPNGGHDPAQAGDTLNEAIVAALRTVHDPEIPVNIYDLGLIYALDVKDGGSVDIVMTLTAPGCPVAGEMLRWVEEAVLTVDGIAKVNISLVFDPPWDKSRMSEETQLELGLL